ncbi:unnamed protein product, partial [Porites lobata]
FSVQTSKLDHHTRPSIQPQIRTPNRNTTSCNRQSDHQIRPLEQTTRSDHSTRPQTTILLTEQHTQPLEMVQVRDIGAANDDADDDVDDDDDDDDADDRDDDADDEDDVADDDDDDNDAENDDDDDVLKKICSLTKKLRNSVNGHGD